jgi:hypothetical protein
MNLRPNGRMGKEPFSLNACKTNGAALGGAPVSDKRRGKSQTRQTCVAIIEARTKWLKFVEFVQGWERRFNRMPMKLTEEIINAAIHGFTAQKAHLNQRIAELRTMLNGGSRQAAPAPEPAPRKPRKMSTASRRKIAAAQRARWAKVRGESQPGPTGVKAPKPKRRISPEGLKRIIAATKKRWQLRRAAAKASKRRRPGRKAA